MIWLVFGHYRPFVAFSVNWMNVNVVRGSRSSRRTFGRLTYLPMSAWVLARPWRFGHLRCWQSWKSCSVLRSALRFTPFQAAFLADFCLFPGAGYPAYLLACMAYERAVRVHYRVVPPQSGETTPRSGSVFRNYLATRGVEHTVPVTLVQALCLRHADAQVVREFHYPFPVFHSTVLGADVHHFCYCCHVLKYFVG